MRVFSLRKRVVRPELMDDAPEPDALLCLRDLERINQRLGGHGVLEGILASVVQPTEDFTVLDVGAATGTAATVIRSRYPGARVISLDRDLFHLASGTGPRVCGDGFRLPIKDRAVDFVVCSLFLHHFEEAAIVALLREAARVARRAVLINDLERRLLPYCFLPATRWLFGWQRMTVHDGVISVAAGFRKGELADLARQAGFAQIREETHRPSFRISVVAQVP